MASNDEDFLLLVRPIGAPPAAPRVAFVFVHGGHGDSKTTWTNKSTYWPTLVPQDPAIGNVAVFAYDYASPKFSEALPVDDLSRAFRGRLEQANLPGYDKIVIVLHSLGGPLVRQFLVDDAAQGGKYLQKIPLVFSCAAAYRGSKVPEDLVKLGSQNPQFKQVEIDSPYLTHLNQQWNLLRGSRSPATQQRPYVLSVRFEKDSVNSKESAEESTDSLDAFPANLKGGLEAATGPTAHTSICKPDGLDFPSHQLLRKAYNKLVTPAA